MSAILALDTATEACSVAIAVDDRLHGRFEIAPRAHARLVLEMVEDVLAEAGISRRALDAIGVARGPGAFTGVRIGMGVAHGLALALDRPLLPYSTLAALAQSVADQPLPVATAIDARMGEVYWAVYQPGGEGLETLADEQVAAPEAVDAPSLADGYVAVGTGWGVHGDVLRARLGDPASIAADALPDARHGLRLCQWQWARGEGVDAAQAQPVYLRDKVTG